MATRTVCLVCAVAVMAACATAWANPPPPQQADPISLDRNSPSVVTFGETPANIYGEVNPLGPIGGGWDVGGPGPILHVIEWSYLPPGPGAPADNNDGHSNGEFDPHVQVFVYFSGDDLSVGLMPTAYRHQSVRNQAAGDRFVTNGYTAMSPAAVMMLGGPTRSGSSSVHSAHRQS